MKRFIVLLGPPGAGKGTQAKIIAERHGLVHVSSGDLFRENLKAQTELGQKAQTYMNRGELVPDDVTIDMIRERLNRQDCQNGALLEFHGKVDVVPYISVPSEVLIERLGGRWTCRAEGHVFHEKFNPPKKAGICDFDGSELYQRDDDKPETVARRIKVYFEQTSPLIEYYRSRGLLAEIDGTLPIDKVTQKMLAAIEKV